mmetsp:Transcript_22073/g.40556  ORF Transcript_22073/g.40556 Transcript_22073/m.40556 type:complete len:113 (+) Transcript_22073:83-421(+)
MSGLVEHNAYEACSAYHRTRSAMAFPEPDEAVVGEPQKAIITKSRSAMIDEEDSVLVPVGKLRSALLPEYDATEEANGQRIGSKDSKNSDATASRSLASKIPFLPKGLRRQA